MKPEIALTGTSASPEAMAFDRYRSVRRFGNLDGLRFICISMVLWHHAIPVKFAYLPILDRGFLGVDFFFVLSGFLITTLLLREAATNGSFSLRGFYLRRILRIIPVYFFVVTCVAAYYIIFRGQRDYLELLPWYYLFQSNFLVTHIPTLGPTWSLSVEEQYYMIWPLLLLLLPGRLLVPATVLLIAVNVAAIMGLFGFDPVAAGPLLFKLPNATYAPIIMGSLAAILLHRRGSFEGIHKIAGTNLAQIVGALGLVAAIQFAPPDVRGLPNLVIHSLMTFLLITLVIREKTPFTPFLSQPLIARVGAISYGIYLYHLLALDIVNRIMTHMGVSGAWIVFFAYFAVSCVIADISFRTLEAYFQRFRPGTNKGVFVHLTGSAKPGAKRGLAHLND